MVSVSGIRGIVGEGLSPELIVNYSAAVGTFYGGGRILIGRDSRRTGDMVKHAVFSGLMSVGCHPVDLGLCPTPTVQLAVQNSDASGGIVITASHNPVQWNALKLLSREGLFLDTEEGNLVKNIIDNDDFAYASWEGVGKAGIYDKAIDDHINAVLGIPYADIDAIRKRRFRVAFDAVNGAGGTILPDLLHALGCEVFPLNEEPHGCFAHTPEPLPENLKDLCNLVKQQKADIGFAVDPDGDRCAIVHEGGVPIGEEYTITLATALILSKKKGDVVVNVSTTRAVDDVVRAAGGNVIRTPVGEIHVAKEMKNCGAVIGGEGNGGILLPEVHLGRDAPVAILLTLQSLLEQNKPMSFVWASLPQYAISKKKINIGKTDPDVVIEELKKRYAHERLNTIDGLKIERDDSWIHIRKSNTEPIIRVMTEAPTAEASQKLGETFLNEIGKIT